MQEKLLKFFFCFLFSGGKYFFSWTIFANTKNNAKLRQQIIIFARKISFGLTIFMPNSFKNVSI